ncbi:MAG: SEL1-like repeat protein [Alphaproteobacteria bacterium]|nr:SEL1-like repeat protein [Alphaproteobacteria bacterium]MBU1514281.1 SEL1-like repeat protein [Alphaproteobacteria bacterium]MBU2097069.1 SEL1-like repeat protein [Alphaproteobacteria bacterium]MBU2152543.1 SEL1-like repeat protein [Alphaproteobacteria bacterium]MBU2308480.1 SEL1-like repeat protein [Alphaproteobacteria bacterium]
MGGAAPWSVKGIDPKAREVAKDLARRSGMTLGEWLNRVILEDDVPDEITAEAQFGDRAFRAQAPRLRAISPPAPPAFTSSVGASPDLSRVAHALDRLTDRIEASETRTGLAINGVEHSVRQALARIETAEREQHAAANRLEGLLAESSAEQSYFGERLRRLETGASAGPRSIEALRLIESRLSRIEPELIVETVLERLGDRLATAEGRTASALEALRGSLASFDRRLSSAEHGGGDHAETRFEALAEVLTHRVEAVRAEVAEKIAAAGGESRFAELTEQVRAAERRSAEAVEEIGRQVLSMAEAVGKKLIEVDQRGAEAIDQVGTEIARIAGAVEQRLARGEHAQAEAFERFGAELAGISARIAAGPAPAEAPVATRSFAPEPEAEPELTFDPEVLFAPESEPEPEAELTVDQAAVVQDPLDPMAEAIRLLGPPPEPEPEPELEAEPEAEPAVAAFGEELYSRSESETAQAEAETVNPPWRRLDLDIPEPRVPDTFEVLADVDDDLFEASEPEDPVRELSTRQVIEQARATARAAKSDAGPAKVRAKMKAAASGRLFAGFATDKAKATPRHSALQTALLVAGGAAFMSVGAAGLTLMQAQKHPAAAPAPQPIALTPDGSPARASMALGPASFASAPADAKPQPVFAQVRADVEAGVPGALATLKSLAEANHAQAQLYLAQLYDSGEAGLPQNPMEARRLTTLAAENGDVKAMHNLGVYLFRGEGGPQDLTSAAQWFGKAATNGVVESQYNLGLLYQSGSGLPKDLIRARAWFERAAAKGDEQARKALAEMGPRPAPKPATTAAVAPAHNMNVRQTQLVLTRLGYYDGPLDGRASVAYDRALAEYRRDQSGGPPLHVYQR